MTNFHDNLLVGETGRVEFVAAKVAEGVWEAGCVLDLCLRAILYQESIAFVRNSEENSNVLYTKHVEAQLKFRCSFSSIIVITTNNNTARSDELCGTQRDLPAVWQRATEISVPDIKISWLSSFLSSSQRYTIISLSILYKRIQCLWKIRRAGACRKYCRRWTCQRKLLVSSRGKSLSTQLVVPLVYHYNTFTISEFTKNRFVQWALLGPFSSVT